jgi:hypothetical protein
MQVLQVPKTKYKIGVNVMTSISKSSLKVFMIPGAPDTQYALF